MSFENPIFLALAVLPLGWMAYEWRRTTRHLGLVLKALSLSAILIALAVPRYTLDETRIAVSLLADTSASASGLMPGIGM